MIITQTLTMARWQIAVKTSEATKQNKDQNDNKKKHASHSIPFTPKQHSVSFYPMLIVPKSPSLVGASS